MHKDRARGSRQVASGNSVCILGRKYFTVGGVLIELSEGGMGQPRHARGHPFRRELGTPGVAPGHLHFPGRPEGGAAQQP